MKNNYFARLIFLGGGGMATRKLVWTHTLEGDAYGNSEVGFLIVVTGPANNLVSDIGYWRTAGVSLVF